MNEPLKIVPSKSDAEVAAEIKAEMVKVYEPVIAALDRAREAGFVVNFQIGLGPLNKFVVTQLQVMKQF